VVATWALVPIEKQTAELRKMYLKKELRGQGMGRYLLERSLKIAKEMGFNRIQLESASCLKEALTLYEKYGFQRLNQSNASDRCDIMMAIDL
jgi:putative acetyltransferase